jgi:hypothetical protein
MPADASAARVAGGPHAGHGRMSGSIMEVARPDHSSPHSAMAHGSVGLPLAPVGTCSSFLTTSSDSMSSTRPKTTCLPSAGGW